MSNKNTFNPTDIDRRRFLKASGLASTAGMAAFAGCSGNGDESTDSPTDGGDDSTAEPTPTADPDDIQEGGTLIWGHSGGHPEPRHPPDGHGQHRPVPEQRLRRARRS